MTRTKKILPAVLIVAALSPTAAMASTPKHPDANAAMRKGIRDFAKFGLGDDKVGQAKASKIHVSCEQIARVGGTGRCTGTFRLTLDGKSADYKLTDKARNLLIANHAMEYHVNANATREGEGLPAKIGTFAGFLQ